MTPYVQLEEGSLNALVDTSRIPKFNGSTVSFYDTSSFIYMLLFSAIIGAAFYEYILVGVYRMEASESGIRKSNETFQRTTLGLLGVFALFLIIFALNKSFLTGDVGLTSIKTVPVPAQNPVITPPVGTTPPTNSTYAARLASHNAVKARLDPSNIKTNYNNAPCSEAQFNQSTPSCTSLSYLPEETIQLLLRINASCGCTLVITGGTEPGHLSHGENRRPIDLRIDGSKSTTDKLYNYLRSVSSNTGETSGCYAVFRYSSFTFCDEKPRGNSSWAPHFHVS